MTVDRELRRLLERALLPEPTPGDGLRDTSLRPQRVPACEILAKLRLASRQMDVNLAELLALVAEAAIQQHDFDTAQNAVDWFLHDCRTKNQFYCRVQLVRALCSSHAAADTTGAARLRRVLDALHFVLLVLPIACDEHRRSRYDFLVYNASVTYWRIARQLMKRATWQFLAPSLIKVLDALKLVGECDALWIARLQLALVSALLDGKQFAEAARTVNELVDAQLTPLMSNHRDTLPPGDSTNGELKALFDAALRAQVHVGSMKDTECQKITANVKKSPIVVTSKRASLLVKLQCIKSGSISTAVDTAYSEIFQEATGFSAFSTATTNDDELTRFLAALNAKSVEGIDADVIVEIGIQAASTRELRVARSCDLVLLRKGKSLAPRSRVLHQVLKAMLLVATPQVSHSWTDSKSKREGTALARRVEAVRSIERAILAAKRLEDPNLFESICVVAWNLSLPLLQPHLRGQLSRIFTLLADALEEMDSLMLELRARLLLEMSKLEITSEFLSKAYASVSKALALDYGASVAQAKTLDEVQKHESKMTTRSVDIHLRHLKKKLQWKLDMEESLDESGVPEDHAQALVEQAREIKDNVALRIALTRVSTLLVELTEQNVAPERLVVPWFDVCKLLKEKLQDASMAEAFAKQGLELFFTSRSSSSVPTIYEHSPESSMRTEKSLVILEIEFRSLLVEILAARLKTRSEQIEAAKKHHLGATRHARGTTRQHDEIELAALKLLPGETVILGIQPPHKTELASGDEKDAMAVQDRAKVIEDEIQGIKRELLGHLSASLTIAGHLGWQFALENTCVSLWNYHFHLFRMLAAPTSSSFSVEWIFRECIVSFEAAYTALEAFPGVDGELLACTALGLAIVYERVTQWDKALAIADAFLKRKKSLGSSTVSAVHLMRFAELKTRAQLAQNAKEINPGDSTPPYLKVAAYLEALEVSSTQQQTISTAGQNYFQKAVALWQSSGGEMVAPMLSGKQDASPTLTMEEAQHQMEIYTELWARIGHGALRMHQFQFAVECSRQALAVLKPLSESSHRNQVPSLTAGTWRWLAVSEILCGRAILALGNGEGTPKKLVLGALAHLANAVEYGDRANTNSLVAKAGEIVWNAALMAFNNIRQPGNSEYAKADVKQVIAILRMVLMFLGKVVVDTSRSPGATSSCFGDLVLLTLAVCENASEWSESCGICEDALASKAATSTPARIINEIRTASAISAAKLGKSTAGGSARSGSAGSRKTEEQSPMLKAKILKKIAVSSVKDPAAQLKALASAYAELDGKPEEQAVLLTDMAEWFYSSRVSAQDTETYLDSATKNLLASELRESDPTAATRSHSGLTVPSGGSNVGLNVSASASALKQDSYALTYSPLWLNEKLIRVFMVRAMSTSSFADRWGYIEKALHCVQRSWESIISLVNTVDLQERYAKAAGSSELDFDEWKGSEKPRYIPPESSQEWIAFYLQFEKSVNTRFYMEWVEKLQSMQTSTTTTLYFTDPVFTSFYLEKLLAMLRDHRLDELALPTICLCQVMFYGYSPEQSHTMRLWLELTLFDILERTNLAACTLPMQSALEIFQEHGKAVIEELRSHSIGSADHISKGVCRRVMTSTSPDLLNKMRSCVRMFVQFGYVRQGKTGLAILNRIGEHLGNHHAAAKSELRVLSALVLDVEGNGVAAAAEIEAAMQQSPALSLRELVQWTIQYCELTPVPSDSVVRLQTTEELVAKWLVTQGSLEGENSTHQSGVGDLDLLLWLAQLKFIRAMHLLHGSSDAECPSKDYDSRAQSRQVLGECEQILTFIDAKPTLSQYLVQYAKELLNHRSSTSIPSSSDTTFAKTKLEQALFELAATRSRVQQFYSWGIPHRNENTELPAAFTTPLMRDLVLVKTLLATLELAAEMSSASLAEHEMMFYAYEADSKRNIVEKWLSETSLEGKAAVGGDLGLAMVLSTTSESAASSANPFDESDECIAIAALQSLQCQRLGRFHSKDRPRSSRIRDKIWTRFTSTESAHTTWICCANASDACASSSSGAGTKLIASDDQSNDVTVSESAAKLHEESEELEAFLNNFAKRMHWFQKLAFDKRYIDLLRGCSLELVQVTGCYSPLECIRSLLVYQSVVVRGHLQKVFEQCTAPRDAQQLHYRRMEKLQQLHSNAAKHSLPYQLSQLFLEQQSSAFKRMSVTVPPETILAALPPHARILSLQLSPDKCFLYCAIVGSGEKQYAMARMECTETVLTHLTHIRECVHRWRALSLQLLAEFEERHSKDPDFEFAATDSLMALNLSSSNDVLEREFNAIIVDTIELFAPLFSHSSLHAVLQSEIPGAALTLLLDRDLECLPLEALPVFEKADSIARDFSLHFLFQRLQTQRAQPFKRDDMRFIVDPYQEDLGLADQTMVSVLHQHIKRPGAAFVSWKDAVDHGQPPTSTDWQHALLNRRGGGIFYLGANRIVGTSVSPSDLLAMSTALNCHVMCLLDRAENTASSRRQSKADSEKPAWQLAIEQDAYANAILWSLAGVNVLVLNQWVTTFNGNRRLASALLSGLARGYSIGKALKKYGELMVPGGVTGTAPSSTASSVASSAASLPPSAADTGGAAGSSSSSSAKSGGKQRLKHRMRFNTVVYGLAHMALKSTE